MTNAPKIDTQAPERVWAGPGPAFGWEDIVGGNYDAGVPDCREFIRADVAAAQTAAAWIAGRDAAAHAAGHHNRWSHLAENIRDLAPPADLAAALDALIAERGQEAYNDGWIRAAKAIKGILAIPQPGTVSEIIDDLIASKMDAIRASKEGRDG